MEVALYVIQEDRCVFMEVNSLEIQQLAEAAVFIIVVIQIQKLTCTGDILREIKAVVLEKRGVALYSVLQ